MNMGPDLGSTRFWPLKSMPADVRHTERKFSAINVLVRSCPISERDSVPYGGGRIWDRNSWRSERAAIRAKVGR